MLSLSSGRAVRTLMRRADAAGGDIRAAGLVDLDGVDRLGGEVREIERARIAGDTATGRGAVAECVRRRHLPAVERHHVELRAEAARGDHRAFAVAAVDRDAGDSLQRLGEIRVRELADVFGIDRVDHADRVALGLHRSLETATQARDHDFLQLLALLLFLFL